MIELSRRLFLRNEFQKWTGYGTKSFSYERFADIKETTNLSGHSLIELIASFHDLETLDDFFWEKLESYYLQYIKQQPCTN